MPPLSTLKIPDYKYIAPLQWRGCSAPAEIARLRLLQSCERLAIPKDLWARIPLKLFPDNSLICCNGWAFKLPDFSLMHQSEAEWRRVARAKYEETCEEFLVYVRKTLEAQIKAGGLQKVKTPRVGGKNAPLGLRYEWAAQRFLLGTEYKDIANQEGNRKYGLLQIKQAIAEVLKEADLSAK